MKYKRLACVWGRAGGDSIPSERNWERIHVLRMSEKGAGMRKVGLLVLATVLTLAANKFASPPVPPTAKRVPNVTEVNGHKLVDNYYWLRDNANPEVKAYLESENAYTDSVMKPTEPLQKK